MQKHLRAIFLLEVRRPASVIEMSVSAENVSRAQRETTQYFVNVSSVEARVDEYTLAWNAGKTYIGVGRKRIVLNLPDRAGGARGCSDGLSQLTPPRKIA